MADYRTPSPLAREAMAYVLAGGRGTRLYDLTDRRAKPAVYFGGKSRIIDFALSNALNSGIRRISVATQYQAHSLIRHLQRGWNFLRTERNESFDVLLQHHFIVHLVDVIAGEQHDELGAMALDDVDVLVDRIRGPEIPHGFGDALAGGQDIKAFVALGTEEIPAHLQMANEAVRLVLSGDGDAADAGVDGVGKREIDDARLATEIDRRLGAAVGQFQKPAAASPRENEGQGMPRQRLACDRSHLVLPMAHTNPWNGSVVPGSCGPFWNIVAVRTSDREVATCRCGNRGVRCGLPVSPDFVEARRIGTGPGAGHRRAVTGE